MHLAGRDGNSLERVKNCNARVCISCRVDDDSVSILVGFLNFINDRTLMVGLEKLDRYADFLSLCLNDPAKVGISIFAIDIGLSYSEHIEIRPVYN